MTEDGEVYKKRKGHVALSPGGTSAQYIEHFHVIYCLETRSSWLNCALRDDEAVYWVSIGHSEAVAVGN